MLRHLKIIVGLVALLICNSANAQYIPLPPHYVWASPTSGYGIMTPRLLNAADLPSPLGSGASIPPNLFLASPLSGSGPMTPRALAAADLPAYHAPGPLFGGRLTLTASSPIIAGLALNQTTLYYAPYSKAAGAVQVSIYNGTTLQNYSFLSSPSDTVGLSLPGLGLTGWAAQTVYDVFVTLSGSVPVLCTGPAWTSTGSAGNPTGTPGVRSTAGSLLLYQGQLTNSNASAMTCRTGSASTLTGAQARA